jgi:hypothetical protein
MGGGLCAGRMGRGFGFGGLSESEGDWRGVGEVSALAWQGVVLEVY